MNSISTNLKTITLLALITLLCQSLAYPTFDEYLQQFSKNYTAEQYETRKLIYDNRIASYETLTYSNGVNEKSDWTEAQIQATRGLLLLPESERVSSPFQYSNRVGNPVSLDWRERGVITSIKQQGSCGACWAFATAAYAQAKLIQQKGYTNQSIDLSEQYILSCTRASDCPGGYMQYAIQTGQQVPLDQKYPYNPYIRTSGICSSSGIRVAYFSYKFYNLTDSQLIQLLQTRPVAITIVSGGWNSYTGGIFNCDPTLPIDHAVLLIGYTEDSWIIKNQWGSDWGEDGFMRITRSPSGNCKIGAGVFTMFEQMSMRIYLFLVVCLAVLSW